MSDIPTKEPTSVTAGDTITWLIALPDYPATDGWALNYALRGAAGNIDITATASGADYLVEITAANSAAWPFGNYQWTKYVEKGAGASLERVTLGTNTIIINRNWAAVTGSIDTRSHARKCLEAIEAVLEGRASRSDAEYEIDTGSGRRRLKSLTVEELLKFHSHYQQFVRQEDEQARLNAGLSSGSGRLLTRL